MPYRQLMLNAALLVCVCFGALEGRLRIPRGGYFGFKRSTESQGDLRRMPVLGHHAPERVIGPVGAFSKLSTPAAVQS